jgi:hypothetical protein
LRRLHGAAGRRAGARLLHAREARRGPRLTTIEGLATPAGPDPVQRAFDVCGALQCGFCQPGMILSAKALLNTTPDPTDGEIREALSGNLCRCTGYTKIFEAVRLAAKGLDTRPPILSGPPAEGFNGIGARGREADAIAKATGEAVYADDIALPRMAHGKLLRSPHAHAKVVSIDTSAAEVMPGVFAVMTGAELPTAFCVIPWTPDETALAVGKVRYIGEGVAAVAAIDEETAIRACDAIRVVYEPLPAVIEPAQALAPGAPLVHELDWKGRPWESNVCKEVDLVFGDVAEGFAKAAATAEGRWFYEGSNHAAIEPH